MKKQALKGLAAWRKRLTLMGVGGWALAILGFGSVGCSPEDLIKGAASVSGEKAAATSWEILPDPDSFVMRLPRFPR